MSTNSITWAVAAHYDDNQVFRNRSYTLLFYWIGDVAGQRACDVLSTFVSNSLICSRKNLGENGFVM